MSRLLVLTVALPMAQCVFAQSVTMPQEYAKYVGSSNTIEAFADFGDQINSRDGKLLFRATDVELPGIGPTIRLTRSYDPDGLGTYFHETSGSSFGAWEIAVPRIRTITSRTLGVSQYSPVGWQVVGTTTQEKNARCTGFSAPSRISFPSDSARGWEAYEWWNGYHLVDDTGNDRAVMSRASTTVRPDMPLMTSDNWLIGCLPATTNGQPGEAFFAIAPDGTKYWFTELVYRQADNIEKPLWSNSPPDFGLRATGGKSRKPAKGPVMQLVGESDFLEREYASMLVTRVEDRFGNWLTYHYTSGRLDSIDACCNRVQATWKIVRGGREERQSNSPGNSVAGMPFQNQSFQRIIRVIMIDFYERSAMCQRVGQPMRWPNDRHRPRLDACRFLLQLAAMSTFAPASAKRRRLRRVRSGRLIARR